MHEVNNKVESPTQGPHSQAKVPDFSLWQLLKNTQADAQVGVDHKLDVAAMS